MEIAEIQANALSSPIEPAQDRQFSGGVRTLHKRDVVLVIIETPDGTRGHSTAGATSSAMREHFEDASQATFADLINGPVADALEGERLDKIADVHDVLAGLEFPELLTSQAASAIDIALYDVVGKQQGAPIYELLRDEAPRDVSPTTTLDLYASAGMYMQPEGYRKQAATIRDLGFFGYKYRPGIGPEADQETIELLLEDSEDFAVMVDAHTWWKSQGYDATTVRELTGEWADDVYWIEEPVSPDNYGGYRDLAATSAPLAGGESEKSPAGLVSLAETGAVQFLQGDVRHHQGYTGCLEVVDHCSDLNDVRFVPHNFGTLVGLVANAHLVAGAVNGELLEYPVFEEDPHFDVTNDPGMYPFDLAFDLIEGELDIENGQFEVPDGPGLGIEVNEDVIEEYPFVQGAWSTFEYDEA